MKQQIKRRLSVLLAVLMLIPSTVMANPEKSIESMTLETGSIPARYVVGQPVIETVGFSAIYTDTTTGSINVGVSDMYKTPDGVAPDVIFDTSESYTGKIGYNNNGDIKFSQDIEVVSKANAIESFTFSLYKEEYETGADVETGGTLTITYDNGWIENTTIASMGGDITFDTSGIDNTKIGHQSITASLYGTTAVSSVNYTEATPAKTPVSLDIEGYKEIYDYEDPFSDTGSIVITYSDTTKEYFALTAEYVTGFDSTVPGPQDITITKNGVSVTKTITINPSNIPTPVSISVVGYDGEYNKGDSFNEVGTVITLMSDNSNQTTGLTVDMVTGFDSSVIGTQDLTVTHNGKTTTISIEIKDNEVTFVEMTLEGMKTEYYINGQFVEQGNAVLHYSDGSEIAIPIKAEMVTMFETLTTGFKTMTINANGYMKIQVYEVKDLPFPVSLEVRDGFVTTLYQGMLITKVPVLVTHDDGSTLETNITSDSITGFDRDQLGGQTITLHYEGITKNINVNVVPDQVHTINMQETIDIVSGTAIEDIDEPVALRYISGKTQVTTLGAGSIAGLDTNIAGVQHASVTFGGVSKEVTFNVALKYSDKVFASVHSDKVLYAPVGAEALDVPLECTVIYTDGSYELAYPSAFVVVNSAIENKTTEGIKTINIDIMPEGEILSQRIQGLVILTEDSSLHGDMATIQITKVEGQKDFELFEELGETVVLTITDGTFSKIIDATHSMVANIDFDTRTVGDKVAKFTVSASEFYEYAYKVVRVPEDEFEGATLTWGTQPITRYTLNQEFYDNTNVVLTKTNGQEAKFTLGECEVTGFDSSKPGVQTITVKLAGKTLSYEVTVLDGTSAVETVAISGETREFKLGAPFDYKGAVRVRYENGTEVIKTLKECSVTGFDSSTEGNKTIMVSFGGESVTYAIKIVKPVISGGGSSGGGTGGGITAPKPLPPAPPAPAPIMTQPIFMEMPTIINMRAPEITAETIKTLNSFVVPASVGSQIEIPTNMGVISVEGKTAKFVDIKNHWAGGTINAAVERGLLNGVSDKEFAPKAELTLEQTLVGLNNVMLKNNLLQMKLQKEYVADKFKSMLEDKTWSTLAVVQTLGNTDLETVDKIAENTNVLKGVITRGELASLLQKLTADILDAGYMEPEEFCKSFGFMVGDTDGNFAADRELSRAELASILLRVDNKIMNA